MYYRYGDANYSHARRSRPASAQNSKERFSTASCCRKLRVCEARAPQEDEREPFKAHLVYRLSNRGAPAILEPRQNFPDSSAHISARSLYMCVCICIRVQSALLSLPFFCLCLGLTVLVYEALGCVCTCLGRIVGIVGVSIRMFRKVRIAAGIAHYTAVVCNRKQ